MEHASCVLILVATF